jgi:hypothetical protein
LPICAALWIGGALSDIAAACLASFVEAGHPVVLYAYRRPDNVPAGVEVADAAEIVPENRMLLFKTGRKKGSPAPFSDLFRYELLASGKGIWIDCDLLCVRPLPGSAHLYGLETDVSINGAVLRLPSESPALADLRRFASAPFTPPWDPPLRRLFWPILHALTPIDVRSYSWGAIGPKALSHVSHSHKLFEQAQPRDVFYPLPLSAANECCRADGDIGRFVTDRTLCIHLWNHRVSRQDVEAGSFMSRVLDGTWRSVLTAV